MAEGYLKLPCHTPTAIVLDRFSGVSDPTVWVYQAERYFNFYGFSKDIWLSIPCLYFDGEALAWFNWLYRNKQFYDWNHFTDKMVCHYCKQTVTKHELSSVTDLLLQMDENLAHMRRHLDSIQNTLLACSHKFSNAQARSDVVDKCDIKDVAEQEIVSALNEDNINTMENSEVAQTMLEPHVAYSKVLPELLNSIGSSSTSIPFPSLVISFCCVETLGPMLDSKNDLKDDPISYACKVFAEMPDKKTDMEVEHPVINDPENPASPMSDEMFHTVSEVKGEHSDLIKFHNNSLALPCLLSACSHAHLMGRWIFDYVGEFDHAKLPLSLSQFQPDQFGFYFPFDPGSSLLTIFLGAARYYSLMVVDDFKEIIRIFTCHIDSTSNAQCMLPQFPFDPSVNLFIPTTDGSLQVSTLQPEASNWDPAICSEFMARIELITMASVFPWRKTHLVLLFALPAAHKVHHLDLDMNVPEICVRKVITTLKTNLIVAFSSCYSVSRVVVSTVELDNCGLLCFSLLLLTIVQRVFQQQLDIIVLTACSPKMVKFIKFGVLNDSWTEYFTKQPTYVFDNGLVVAPYHVVLDVAGQIHREVSAQILHGTNILDYILSMLKLVVSINCTMNVDPPLVSQNEVANSRNRVAWVFDISIRRDKTSFLIPLANTEYIVTKEHTKLLVSVMLHIYNDEIVLFESLYLLQAEGWSLPALSRIWHTMMLIGKGLRELLTLASNLLLLVGIASLIAPIRIVTMKLILYYSNLEEKVLIGAVGIVMNGPRPVLAEQPNTGLSVYVWDPG